MGTRVVFVGLSMLWLPLARAFHCDAVRPSKRIVKHHVRVKPGQTITTSAFGSGGGGRVDMSSLQGEHGSKKNLVTQVTIVGAGVSGLVCARALAAASLDVLVVEAADRVGGRVRTDVVHDVGGSAFLLDRGFQVFLDAYPVAGRELDLAALDLRAFLPGALVHTQERRAGDAWPKVADPLRRPQDLAAALTAPVGTLLDKVKVGAYRLSTLAWSTTGPGGVFERPEMTTFEHLKGTLGLSDSIIDRFFRPFYQGIFLAPLEEQSSRLFEFVFLMFAKGRATLPSSGMQAVPDQLLEGFLRHYSADNFDNTHERWHRRSRGLMASRRVASVAPGRVVLAASGEKKHQDQKDPEETIICDIVVVATDGPSASRLIGEAKERERARNSDTGVEKNSEASVPVPRDRGVTCIYFAFYGPPPVTDPILILNGNQIQGTGLNSSDLVVNNVCFPSQVSSTYAPAGQSLASVTVVGLRHETDAELANKAKAQLSGWFGPTADVEARWRFLRSYRIAHAQPGHMFKSAGSPSGATTTRSRGAPFERDPAIEGLPDIFCCGDYMATPTLNGALESGCAAADAVLRRYTPERNGERRSGFQSPPVWEQWIAQGTSELPQTPK